MAHKMYTYNLWRKTNKYYVSETMQINALFSFENKQCIICNEDNVLHYVDISLFRYKCMGVVRLFSISLIPKCEYGIEAKQNAIHNRQRGLDKRQITSTRPK